MTPGRPVEYLCIYKPPSSHTKSGGHSLRSSYRPSFDRKCDDDPCHQECSKAHGYCERKHGKAAEELIMVVLRNSRISLDYTSIPQRPPPKNMMDMETCSKSCGLHVEPHAARCSSQTLDAPYRKMTNDSTNSADGMRALRELTTPMGGLTFHAQPISAKHPIHRPSVSSPYQKKMPPLTLCARLLKMLLPRNTPPYTTAPLNMAIKPRSRLVESTVVFTASSTSIVRLDILTDTREAIR